MSRLEQEINEVEAALSEALSEREKLEEQALRKNEIENERKTEIE